MRIGLFGGSFNPVHIGHLRAAEEIRGLCSLEKVIFIPTHIAPHKPVRTLASPQHRLTMLELAIQDNRHFLVSDAELRRPGRSYSVETLRYFRAAFPEADPFFIMGMDAFAEIDTWKNYRDLFPLCNFVVMTRPGYSPPHRERIIPRTMTGEFSFSPEENRYRHASGSSVFIADIPGLAISAREIRRRVAQGHSFTYLVPKAVEEYILQHKLYHNPDSNS